VKLARLRRPKIVCSASYADCKPKTNAVILLDMGYTLSGEHVGIGKKTQNFKVFDVPTVEEVIK
jgi:hypothetical protein